MIKKCQSLLSLTSIVILLSGCIQTNIIEDLGIVTTYGFDKEEQGDEILATTVMFQFNPNVSDASQIINSRGHTFREVRNNANKKSGHKITSGQLRSVLFGPTVAKEGIFRYLDTLKRDAAISDLIFVTMSLEPARDLLVASNFEEAPNIGTYIQRLLDTAVRDERIVSSTLHAFSRTFFSVGQDPMIPILGVEQNKVQINGLGMLQKDKYVGFISLEEAFYARLLIERFKSGQIEIELPTEKFQSYLEDYEKAEKETFFIVIDQLSSNSNVKVQNSEGLKFKVDIQIAGRIVEMTERVDLENKEVLKLFEEEINKEVENKLNKLISKSKEANADIMGFGKTYKATRHGKDLTSKEWRDQYPNIEVDVTVHSEIKSYGIVE